MKKALLIIGLCLMAIISPQKVQAKILEDCQLKPYKEIKDDATLTDLEFRLAFEQASTQYHEYVNCVFNKAGETVLKSVGGDPKNLLSPNDACLTDKNPKKMQEALKDSSPENLLQPLLKAYKDYVAYLSNLKSILAKNPDLSTSSSNPFGDFIKRQTVLKQLVENETQQAIIALDNAFTSLKELRQAFVIHLHFQCMLKNLDLYQRALGNLRSIISVLPPLIHNASTQP